MHHRIRAIACAALCAAPLTTALAQQFPPPYQPVRIVTYNVKNGFGFVGSTVYNAVGDMITIIDDNPNDGATGLNPDIVCFQEMDDSSPSLLQSFRDQFLPGYTIYTAFGDGFNYNAVLVSPEFTVTNAISFGAGGPRGINRVTISIPGANETLTVYNAHYKSGSDSASQNQRRNEADTTGNVVLQYRYCGGPCGDPLSQQPLPLRVVLAGDLNSNNNVDGTIDGVFTHFTLGVPTGLINLPVETFLGRTVPQNAFATFSSGSRLDYICPDDTLAFAYDADNSGILSQTEINSMGFSYWSNENTFEHTPGQFANGNANATSQGSDHRPVVMDLRMPAAPASTGACCLGFDCVIQTEEACAQLGGEFQGLGTDCTINPCNTAGACCFSCNGTLQLTCTILDEADCIANEGLFLGVGTDCTGGPCADQCPGDIDYNGFTNLGDFNTLAVNFGATGVSRAQGDLNCDGIVNLADFNALAVDFGCVR